MTPLIDHLRALLGGHLLASEVALLTAADTRAAKLVRRHGVLHSKAVEDAIHEMTTPAPCACEDTRAAYYLGLQAGWRAAQRVSR